MGNISVENDRAAFTDLCTTQIWTDRNAWHQVATGDAIYSDRGWVSISCGPRPAAYKGINEVCVKGQNTDITPVLGPIYSAVYGSQLLVVNYTGNSIGVINCNTNVVSTTYSLGAVYSASKPRNIVNVSTTGTGPAHVVIYENGTMLPISVDTGATGTPVTPTSSTYTLGGTYINDSNISYILIPNYRSGGVDIYNPTTFAFIRTIPTPAAQPNYIQYNPANQKVYIGTFNTNQVFVFTTGQIKAIALTGSAQYPTIISVMPQPSISYTTSTPIGNFAMNGNNLYVLNTTGQRVYIIDSTLDQITFTYNATAPIDRVLYANSALYVTQVTSTILKLDPATLALQNNIQLQGFQRLLYLTWQPSNASLYVGDFGTPNSNPPYDGSRVSVISTGTNTGAGFYLQQQLFYTDGAHEAVPNTDSNYSSQPLTLDNTPGLVSPPYLPPNTPSQTITCTVGV